MTATVQYPVRLARSTPDTLAKLHQAAVSNPHDVAIRHALADSIEEMGDEGYHNFIRTLHPTWQGVWNGRNQFAPPSAKEEADILRSNVPDPAHTQISVYEPWTHTAQESRNFADWDTNFSKGYSIIPAAMGGYSIAHHPEEFYEADERSPGELPGLDDDNFDDRYANPPVDHSVENAEDRNQYSRIKYARTTPDTINALFQELIKNPTDAALRHATADALEENGQTEDAALLRQSIQDKARAIRKHMSTTYRGDEADRNTPIKRSDRQHLETALWSTAYDDMPLNHIPYSNIDPDVMASMLDDWHRFRAQHRDALENHSGTTGILDAAHNFWLSRNGHGTGFFDDHRLQQSGHAEHLQDSARQYGEFHLQGPEPQNEEDAALEFQFRDPEPRDNTITGTSYVDTSNEGPQRMSRIKYAAQERRRHSPEETEAAFLEAISKDPTDPVLHHAYADHLTEQGRHGEAAFMLNSPDRMGKYNQHHQYGEGLSIHQVMNYYPTLGDADQNRVLMSAYGPRTQLVAWFSPENAMKVMRSASQAGVRLHPRSVSDNPQQPEYIADRGTYHQIVDAYDSQNMAGAGDEEPVRHAAYRAPKGGAVVRGSYYQGGKLLPDLEGDFANPPVPEQPVTPPQYPQPKRPGLRERLKAKMGKKPLVVSYARTTPEVMRQLFDAVRRDDVVKPDPALHAALGDVLREAGRHQEAEILSSGRFAIDLNGGGKIVKGRPPARMRIDRNTRGVGYHQLREQLDHGRSRMIGPNLEIAGGNSAGDIHIHYHGNHIVTAHPNGDYTIFTRGWGHAPSTRAVIGRVTGNNMSQRRGTLYYGGVAANEPFQEGQRYNSIGVRVSGDGIRE